MRSLRILMVAPQPFFRARGTPFSILHRIRALVEAGHSVVLVTYPFGEEPSLPGLRIFRSRRLPLIKDVKIGPSFSKLLLDIPLYIVTRRLLHQRDFDVLHSHEEAAFFAVGLARRHGLRHIYDMHSSLPQQLRNFSAYDFRFVRKLFEWLERRVLLTCDGIITICPELAETATTVAPGTPHAMIENTAENTKVFGDNLEDLRAQLNLKNKQVIVYTGTFERYQGLDLLLQAFSQVLKNHSRAHLLMVGGNAEQIDRYRRVAQTLGNETAITFAGTVHPSRIPSFLTAADLIVSPRSRGTNTPLKIYDYMRSRRPLVATDLPTHTQVLDDRVACLVPPNETGLAQGMARLLDDPALGAQLAEAAAMRAKEHFSDQMYLDKVREFYERAAAPMLDRQAHEPVPLQS
ncbi:MAG: glycosyltransferase family 4 protein [Candidatus Binatia bacterium]